MALIGLPVSIRRSLARVTPPARGAPSREEGERRMSASTMDVPRTDSGEASSDSTADLMDANHPDACMTHPQLLFLTRARHAVCWRHLQELHRGTSAARSPRADFASQEELKALFETHGSVAAVVIKRDRYTGNSLGYAFVQFEVRLASRCKTSGPHRRLTIFQNRANAATAKRALHKHGASPGPRLAPLRLTCISAA